MAMELGVASSVIAVANVAFVSCKTLHDLIKGMRDAPQELSYLQTDLDEVGRTLNSFADLSRHMGVHENTQYRAALEHSLEQLRPCIGELGKTCDAFRASLSEVFKHSTPDRMSSRDRFNFQFQERNIVHFRTRLDSYKNTLTVALGLASLAATSSNARDISNLEELIKSTNSALAIQHKGVETELSTVAAPNQNNTDTDRDNSGAAVRETELTFLRQQKQILEDCLKVCAGVSHEVRVLRAEASDDSKQFVGNIGKVEPGGPGVNVNELIARDRSRQVAGNIDGASALEFLK